MDSLLAIRGLSVQTKTSDQAILRGVDLTIRAGEAVGIVGESGSGKSMTLRAVMRALPESLTASGDVRFKGESILGMGRTRLADFRAHQVGMIYQDPRAHVNPLWTVGNFLTEGVIATRSMSRRAAVARAADLLDEVGVSSPRQRMSQYPMQLSGGILQRVMIVAALMPEPALLLADEPTTALDVTVQAEVMGIFADITRSHKVGLVFITHDLDLAAAATDRIGVMYAGRIVEEGPSREVISNPRHPYTAALLASRPSVHEKRLPVSIPGNPASAAMIHSGCEFAERCAFAIDDCLTRVPPLRVVEPGRTTACIRAHEPSLDVLRSRL